MTALSEFSGIVLNVSELPSKLRIAHIQNVTNIPYYVHGWSLDPTQQLRGNTINALDLDVFICETFLLEDQEINVPGYKWFRNNRKLVSKRACRGLGGVGILVRTNILEVFDVAVISEKFEGILWIQLIQKSSTRNIGIRTCYLPPIGSSRGDQSVEFFDSIKALIIDNYHMDDFIICGDFNTQCGNMDETSGLEGNPVPKRVAVDLSTNQLGKELIATLKALDLCILNGRFTPKDGSHTSIFSQGMSVVEYIITPVKSFTSLSNFKVLDPFQVATESNIDIDTSMPEQNLDCKFCPKWNPPTQR